MKIENLGDTIGSTGCNWSSLNAPGTEILVSDSEWEISIFPFSAWGNKNWPPVWKLKSQEIWGTKLAQPGCNWSKLNATGTEIYVSHSSDPSKDKPSVEDIFMSEEVRLG